VRNNDNSIPESTSVALSSPTSFHEYTFSREGELSVSYEQDGANLATIFASVPLENLHPFMWNDSASDTITYDWVRVRPYVAPEPAVVAGAPESSGPYCGVGPTPTPTSTPVPAPWWDENYLYRMPVLITGNSGTGDVGETVRITLNTSALVSAGKMRADGNDLWIVYWDGGSQNTAIARQLYEMNGTSTDVWFELQAPIPLGVTVTSYFVYYGYAESPDPPTSFVATPTSLEFYEGDGNILYQDAVLQCGVDADVNSDDFVSAGSASAQEDTTSDGCDANHDLVHVALAQWANFFGVASWQVPTGARILEDASPTGSRIRLWGGGVLGPQVEASAILQVWQANQATWNQRYAGASWPGFDGAGADLLGSVSSDLLGFDGVSSENTISATMGNDLAQWGALGVEGPTFAFEYDASTIQRWVTGRLQNRGLVIHTRASGLNGGVLWISEEGSTLAERPRLTVVFYPHVQPEPITSLGPEDPWP
jgi:hypothetical protein